MENVWEHVHPVGRLVTYGEYLEWEREIIIPPFAKFSFHDKVLHIEGDECKKERILEWITGKVDVGDEHLMGHLLWDAFVSGDRNMCKANKVIFVWLHGVDIHPKLRFYLNSM